MGGTATPLRARKRRYPVMLEVALGLYAMVLVVLAVRSRRRVHDVEDYLVAGRRLPLWMAWPTLLATWFGAGTILTATDAVRAGGMRMAALDPIGAGVCLLLAGAFVAGPLWRMKLLTLPELFGRRFGPRARRLFAIVMIPGYYGWIAAQFVALADVLALCCGWDPAWGIVVAAAAGTAYTLVGGMWSVTVTDVFQMAVVAVGLVSLGVGVATTLGDGAIAAGVARFFEELDPDRLSLIPLDRAGALAAWSGALAAGALGNLPGQDLAQRIFAARSERTAVWACHLSGLTYLSLGLVPLLAGLAADLVVPNASGQATLPLLATAVLSPFWSMVFILAVISAVLSTVDSAILSPSSVLAQDLVPRRVHDRFGSMAVNRAAVLSTAGLSLLVARLGRDAYSLLETAYEVGLVGLVVPLLMGLRSRMGDERAALASMTVGTTSWGVHLAAGWDAFLEPWLAPGVVLPMAPLCSVLGLGAYVLASRSPSTRPSRTSSP